MDGTSEFWWMDNYSHLELVCYFCCPAVFADQNMFSSEPESRQPTLIHDATEICTQPKTSRLCVLFMNHIRFDLENKLELYFHTTLLSFSVYRVTSCAILLISVQKIMSVMLYKVRMADRMDICYISICFCLVILNKVKLKNGLKCLTAVGFEAERRHVWHSCDLCCYKSS